MHAGVRAVRCYDAPRMDIVGLLGEAWVRGVLALAAAGLLFALATLRWRGESGDGPESGSGLD